jgi:pyruvate,water dikinase
MAGVTYTLPFNKIVLGDVPVVGGKNASLGEMISNLSQYGIHVPDGFATTADAYRSFLRENDLEEALSNCLSELDTKSFANLDSVAERAQSLILNAKMPDELRRNFALAYKELCDQYDREVDVAVRSSATAEDLPNASFAGQHESYLNRHGGDDVLLAVQQCYASLFGARAIKYRIDNGFEHLKVALSAGVQIMVRSDLASSGIAFTLDPQSGFRNVVAISATFGLGENIVQGTINPDEYIVFKPTLKANKQAIISKKLGSKAKTLIYKENKTGETTVNVDTPDEKRIRWAISDSEIEQIARWAVIIEDHYKAPMDIEWAKDGITETLFIVQARPETVHSAKNPYQRTEYELTNRGEVLAKGSAVGSQIASGIARVILSSANANKLQPGEILVTTSTNPDWDPILKKAAAIVTDKGGRTSHAAIVAREVGAVAVVGTGNATTSIQSGDLITVSCSEGAVGYIYKGKADWKEHTIDLKVIERPKTKAMLILGDPDKAFDLSFYPNDGIGLMRLEFIINTAIRIHPMALVTFSALLDEKAKAEIAALTVNYENKEQYFIDKLSEAVATIGAAFYPKDVIVRMSDFKTNEYANLIGGNAFEPKEENPMLGFRGASRYYNDRYREGFRLECLAMKKVREEMGLTNIKLMIPFCRTVDEGKKVIALMKGYGLNQGNEGLEIYVMAEIPSNVILAKEFAQIFDGFSIGSNDLTQLTLGLDRDSSIISELFDENNPAVKNLISSVISTAKAQGRKIGLCGQAPSDYPEFAKFLIECGIDSISYNADALLAGMQNMVRAEKSQK